MINSFSVASSHTAANAGAGAAAITLHFNYNSSSSSNNNHNNNNIKGNINYNNNNNNSGLKILTAPMATSTNEHKSHNPNTTTTTTTAKMFKITQSEVEAKHFLMTYPQQQQQQQNKSGGASKWLSPGKVNTSAITKEPQFIQVNSQSITNISNNNNISSQKSMQTTTTTTAKPKSAFIGVMSMPQERQQQQKQRTEDQENAFRQIEDVHNYAKLQHHQQHHLHHPHQQSSSSDELCEEEDDEEDEDEDEDEDRQQQKLKVNVPNNLNNNNNHEDSEEHVEVDVVTVTPTTITPQQQQLQQQEQQQQLQLQQLTAPVADQDMRPEHHARRPMNAFLIFCKRHRAIVKDRYKSLENRAITKILGDWWAALDEQEKQCFTDLAQQNKDAFFNANPNFKWYKLPAPPLRTLATRPSNANSMAHSTDEHQQQQHIHWEPNEVAHMLRRNYFKFADETQMGDLSALLSASAAANVRGDDKDYALQQALSETTQFLSAHMPGNNNNNNIVNNNNKIKRSLQPTATAAAESASNSSEEEERGSPSKKLKSTRSCKGKIYQELINSGQLAAIAKKSKCRLNSGSSSSCTTDANSSTPPISPTGGGANNTLATAGGQLLVEIDGAGGVTSHTGSSSIGDEFDLEEKIKELPALSLDAYLQRKRSTKKKKKFSSSKKQRNSNSNSSNSNVTAATAAAKKAAAAMAKKCESVNPAAAAATAVGSQKRKARKESITRRDVSAIEQEVASILPLTINGCYYINQTPQAQRAPQTASSPLSSASSTEQQQPVVYDATSTSDLLILAEVAANRTELSKSN